MEMSPEQLRAMIAEALAEKDAATAQTDPMPSKLDKVMQGVGSKAGSKLRGFLGFGDAPVANGSLDKSIFAEAPTANLDTLGGWTSPGEIGAAGQAPGAFSMGNIGGAGNALLPMAGALGAYDVFANKRHGARGALQGAASGAAMGSYFGPVGTGVGAVLGGGLGYFGDLGDKDRFKDEYNRAQKLRDAGIDWGHNSNEPLMGRTKEELIANAQASGGNVQFAGSRNESDLTGNDIVGYSALPEKFGKSYADASLDKKLKVANAALSAGAVKEHHGTVDIDWSKLDPSQLESYLK